MQGYIIRRVLLAVPTLLLVTVGAFALIRLVPGDVVVAKVGDSGNHADLDKVRHELGLDAPFHVQYLRFVRGVLTGNPPKSLWTSRSVAHEFFERLPTSLELGLMAMAISVVVAVPAGVISAIRQDRAIPYVARAGSNLATA